MTKTMKKLHTLLYTLLFGAAVITMASCTSSDDFERAPKVADGVIGAYFPTRNAASSVISPEQYAESQEDTIVVYRKSTEGAATVPVIVDYADSVFEIPSQVEFKDGESEATLVVKYPNMEKYKEYKYSMHLDDAYTNPYAMVEGSTVFNYTVMISTWEKVVNGMQVYFNENVVPTTYSDVYHLEGVNRFYIENFLGSGVNLNFKIIPADKDGNFSEDNFDADDMKTWVGSFVPVSNFYQIYDDSYDYYYWWLMTDDNDYAAWDIDGFSLGGLSGINFMKDESSDSYASIDMNGVSGTSAGFLYSYIYYKDDTNSGGWVTIYLYIDKSDIPEDIIQKYNK